MAEAEEGTAVLDEKATTTADASAVKRQSKRKSWFFQKDTDNADANLLKVLNEATAVLDEEATTTADATTAKRQSKRMSWFFQKDTDNADANLLKVLNEGTAVLDEEATTTADASAVKRQSKRKSWFFQKDTDNADANLLKVLNEGTAVLDEEAIIADPSTVKRQSKRVSWFFQKDTDNADTNLLKALHRKSWFFQKDEKEEKYEEEMPQDIVEIQPEDPQPVGFTQLFRYSTSFELTLDAIGLFCAMAAATSQPFMALIFGRLIRTFTTFSSAVLIYDNAQRSGNTSAISSAQQALDAAGSQFRRDAAANASYLTYIGVGMFVCTYVYMCTWIYTGEVNTRRIREKYLQGILRQDISYFDKVGAGEVTTRIQTDTHLVQQAISEKVALIVYSLCSFTTGFVLAYVQNWRLALAMSFIFPCLGVAGGFMNKYVSKYMEQSLQEIAESGTLAENVISTVRTAQAFGSQRVLGSLFDQKMDKIRSMEGKSAIWNGCGLGFFFFVIYCAYSLAFYFGTTLINDGHADAGQVVNVIMSLLISSFALATLGPDLQSVSHGCAAAAKLYATIERIPDIDSASPEGLTPENVSGEITLQDVEFSYPARPDISILKGLSITFQAGKTAALVGGSGSGKSTIISLVERFYDPVNGSVKLDGVALSDLNLKWLRSQIGLVSQEPVLFSATIKENVAYGLIGSPHEHASDEEKFQLIKDACVKSNADGFITQLPQGYDTAVGERGFLLSGGQKQRIAIARAIVSDPRILLLDEATSALDTQSEGIVQDALDKASAGRTTISIAHRLSTIKNVDQIFVLEGGVVLEQGTHQQLLANDGPYTRLLQAQQLRESAVTEEPDSAVASCSDAEKAAGDVVSLGRQETRHSVTSELAREKNAERKRNEIDEGHYSFWYLIRRLGGLGRPWYFMFVIGAFSAIVAGMVFPVFSIIYGRALTGFSQPDPAVRRHDGNMNALWFLAIAFVTSISVGSQNYFFTHFAAELTTKLRILSFRSILRQDAQFFDREENNTGALTAQVNGNPQKVNNLIGVTLGAIFQAITTLVGGTVVGLIYAWKPALVGIASVPLVFSAGFIRLYILALQDQQSKTAHANSAKIACEAAGSIRTVSSLTREADCLKLYSDSLDEPIRRSNKTSLWTNLIFAFSQSATFWAIALFFWYGSTLASKLEISITSFFTALMATTFGAMQAGALFLFVPDMAAARNATASMVKLFDMVPDIEADSSDGKTFEGINVGGQLRLENVHFRYPTRPAVRVLRGLDLTIEPGAFVALVGASGCGKSTVIQLIERFYDPLVGQVLLDGQPINEYNVQEYRKQIALVSQEPTLYAGTIRFNILLGATKPMAEVTQEDIEAACQEANILDFIRLLPNGFETEVGGKGSQLSGGQKQRIAIARALLRRPKVLLLDEATSALDSKSERIVQRALDKAAKGRTTIAVAHRLSTIQNADRIYFIKNGRVHEAGTHDELLALKGDYYEYVQLQLLQN